MHDFHILLLMAPNVCGIDLMTESNVNSSETDSGGESAQCSNLQDHLASSRDLRGVQGYEWDALFTRNHENNKAI